MELVDRSQQPALLVQPDASPRWAEFFLRLQQEGYHSVASSLITGQRKTNNFHLGADCRYRRKFRSSRRLEIHSHQLRGIASAVIDAVQGITHPTLLIMKKPNNNNFARSHYHKLLPAGNLERRFRFGTSHGRVMDSRNRRIQSHFMSIMKSGVKQTTRATDLNRAPLNCRSVRVCIRRRRHHR